MATIQEVTRFLEDIAPVGSQESYDNCGLIIGDSSEKISNILVTLDCTEEIVQEAIDNNCNFIIAHHPIIFNGLKKINGKNYVERTVLKAIKHDIAIYAIHTNLDNAFQGVNAEISRRLKLINTVVLQPKKQVLSKLVVYVPFTHSEQVKSALFEAGAGHIGNYKECSFSTRGTGTYKPVEGSNPYEGVKNIRSEVEEEKVEVLLSNHKLNEAISNMLKAHPYEEVAYDLIPIQNVNPYEGAGMIGELEVPIPEQEFLDRVKKEFNCGCIRHTEFLNKPIKRVAVCGGSGSFLLKDSINCKADIYITADMKYHEFFDAGKQILIADIGHYESEQFTSDLIIACLKENFTKFAILKTRINTNPIKYF